MPKLSFLMFPRTFFPADYFKLPGWIYFSSKNLCNKCDTLGSLASIAKTRKVRKQNLSDITFGYASSIPPMETKHSISHRNFLFIFLSSICRKDNEDKRHKQVREQLYSRKTYSSLLYDYTSKVRKA